MNKCWDVPRSEHTVFVGLEMNECRPSSRWCPCVWIKNEVAGSALQSIFANSSNSMGRTCHRSEEKNVANRRAISHEIVLFVKRIF